MERQGIKKNSERKRILRELLSSTNNNPRRKGKAKCACSNEQETRGAETPSCYGELQASGKQHGLTGSYRTDFPEQGEGTGRMISPPTS